jgi:glycosyltransferase involved in cell wall biosynthesis
MRAAFAYHLDAASPSVQSGRPYSILLHLRQLGLEVEEKYPLHQLGGARRRLSQAWNHLRGRQYLVDRDEELLRGFARQLQAGLRDSAADFVFSPSTLPLSYLETDLPITFCADAPFCAMVDYYASFTKLGRAQFDTAEKLEGDVLRRAALAVYPTQWAAQQAVAHYGLAPERVAVIPFGANFGRLNQAADVHSWIEARAASRPIRLLFVGSEWARKGGDLVIATADWLAARGTEVAVDLVGCRVPYRYRDRPYLAAHGRLRPHLPEERAQLTRLFQRAHLLFVPSRAEAYGMTFCEANAFGLPALTTATGGITEVVQHGVNGAAFPVAAGPEHYGAWIRDALDPERYTALAHASFLQFTQRLNWNAYGRAFLDRISQIVQPKANGATLASAPVALNITTASGQVDAPTPSGELHVAFVADEYTNPTNVSSWSGTPYFAMKALERQGIRFSVIHLEDKVARLRRWANFILYRLLHRKRYLRDRHAGLLRAYAREIREKLHAIQPDLVFSMGTAPIAYLECDRPIVFWVDGTFAGMAEFYRSFSSLARVSVREGARADQGALSRAALAIYSSDWAAGSARQHYEVEPKAVRSVNLGANLLRDPQEEEIMAAISRRDHTICRLLFVGVEWERKGADTAIAVAAAMRQAGVETTLTMIGCLPPKGLRVPDFVKVVGFVSKRTPEGNRLIEEHFRDSHFFVLPTRAEAYGMVFCESSAFGLPSLAPRVGGIPSIIEDGVNGWLLPVDAQPEAYAAPMLEKWHDRAAYEAMARASYGVFRDRLNWDAAAARVAGLMRECVRERRNAS